MPKLPRLINSSFLWLALGLASTIACARETLAPEGHFDEIYERDAHGKTRVRPQYAPIMEVYEQLSEAERKSFVQKSQKAFAGDNALDPLPRVLTEGELDTLKRGTAQRGRALQMFLTEFYGENPQKSYEKVIPRAVLERIVARAGESRWKEFVNLKRSEIAFPYGPDIIRDRDGTWRVIEDNPGFIGGPGDLLKARETLNALLPQYNDKTTIINDPAGFYRGLTDRFALRARPKGGAVAMLQIPPYPDNEDARLRAIMKKLGIAVVSPHSAAKLEIRPDGVYLRRTPDQPTERVGYLILNGEHKDLDWAHALTSGEPLIEAAFEALEDEAFPSARKKTLRAALKPDKKTQFIDLDKIERALEGTAAYAELQAERHKTFRGLIDAMLDGRVRTNYSPGVDFIGDKSFYLYVEDLIRHYLGEEPILRNIESGSFARIDADGKVVVDEKRLTQTLANPAEHVIKRVDGRGGDSVWVGAKIPVKEFRANEADIRKDPSAYIDQRYTPLSVLGERIVDIRMISAVDPAGVFVSDTPWGRSLLLQGDGKVNLGAHGRESPVLVVAGSACQETLRSLAQKPRGSRAQRGPRAEPSDRAE